MWDSRYRVHGQWSMILWNDIKEKTLINTIVFIVGDVVNCDLVHFGTLCGGRRRIHIFTTESQTPSSGSRNVSILHVSLRCTKTTPKIDQSCQVALCVTRWTATVNLTHTFSPFATFHYHLHSKASINLRNLVFYHSSWGSEGILQLPPVTLEISTDSHGSDHFHTQTITKDPGLNSAFSTTKSQSHFYFSGVMVWSIVNILDDEWAQCTPSLQRTMHLSVRGIGIVDLTWSRHILQQL